MERPKNRLPEWFQILLPRGKEAAGMHRRLKRLGLHTVCESARCPNQAECWGAGTATVMIMGDVCTRRCRFCNVRTGHPDSPPDPDEPGRVAEAVSDAGLKYVVLTSVDRDDLPDGGASYFAATIRAIKDLDSSILVEALIPDYLDTCLETVLGSGVDVVGHNVEVVERLTSAARDRRASWDRSLQVIRQINEWRGGDGREIMAKSSIMVGIGETDEEVQKAILELKAAGVTMITIGQYLQPAARHLPVDRYVEPAVFDEYAEFARSVGIDFVASGPLVRSSYRAAELYAMKRLSRKED